MVYTDTAVVNYLKGRVTSWVTYFKAKDNGNCLKNIRHSLAMAIVMQKRYLRGKLPTWMK